ncbi:MAG TPA: c-type cytochrome domain-containing protein [Terracidiphilus sp.]|nr:c-type cytochrome domain-containing protein [Terracidiphilus sp.]
MPTLFLRIRAHGSPRRPGYACIAIAAVLVLVGAGGGETPRAPRTSAAPAPSFAKDVAPILQKNCIGCHSSNAHKGGLTLDSYESLMKGGKHGEAIIAHDANASRLVQMIEGKLDPQMPLYGNPLPAADIKSIRSWINAGAKGPAPGTASPTLAGPVIPSIAPQVPVVSPVASVKFSPDGRVLAVGGYQEVRLIDASSGKLIARLTGHADSVRSIAFSPDGKMLAAAGGPPQREGEIKIWDLQTRQLIRTLNGHKDCVYSVAWSPDGRMIASGSYDKAIKLWDASTGKELRTLQDHIDAVFAVAFSPDGKHLASASQDRTVKIWEVASGKRLYTLSDASDGLTSLVYSPTGKELAAGGYDKTIYVWEVGNEDGHLLHSLIADEDSLLSLAWSHDGKTLVTASADGSIRFRDPDLDLKGVVERQPDWVEALDVSSDGKWLAAGRYNGSVSFYDLHSYQESRSTMVFDIVKPTDNEKTREAASR